MRASVDLARWDAHVPGGSMGQPPQVIARAACGFDAETEARVGDALRNVMVSDDAEASERECREAGVWPADVTKVEVVRQLTGGRGGAEVLEIQVHGAGSSSLQVAKLMPLKEAAEEWAAYGRLKKVCDDNLYVGIVAVSEGVYHSQPTESPTSVVVYRHVADWDHRRMQPLRSLEDAVTTAVTEGSSLAMCEEAVSAVTHALCDCLYERAALRAANLEGQNAGLGFDLELSVDSVQVDGGMARLVAGNPGSDEVFPSPSSAQVLRCSTAPPGGGRSLGESDMVRVTLKNVVVDEVRVTGTHHMTTVLVKLAGKARSDRQWVEIPAGKPVEVLGRVTAVRSQTWSRFLAQHFDEADGLEVEDGSFVYEGVSVPHPLTALHSVITVVGSDRLMSPVHGDLNPRNVMLSGDTPYLIDFMSFKSDAFTLADLTWLEVCLLRDCMASALSWSHVVRLQRFLGLLTLIRPTWPSDALDRALSLLSAEFAREDPALSRCLTILWRVRSGMWDLGQPQDLALWPRHYFEHLVLSACRTFKWPVPERPERVRMSAAVASVAAECMSEAEEFFRQWPKEDVRIALRILLTGDQVEGTAGALLAAAAVSAEDPAGRGTVIKRLSAGFHAEARLALKEHYAADTRGVDPTDPEVQYMALEGHELAPGEAYVLPGNGTLSVSGDCCLALLTQHPAVVLLADPGAGKSTIARRLQTLALQTPQDTTVLPLWVSALEIIDYINSGQRRTVTQFLLQLGELAKVMSESSLRTLLSLGAVHLTIDSLHLLTADHRRSIMAWLKRLRTQEPSLGLLICERVGDYNPNVLRWPAVVVHKVREQPARTYLQEMLRRRNPKGWQRKFNELEGHLFRDPEATALRELAGRPIFLRMLVEQFDGASPVPPSPVVMIRSYLDQLLSDGSTLPGDPDRLLIALGALARHMGSTAALSRPQALKALMEHPAGGDAGQDGELLLTQLMGTTIVTEASGRISFREPFLQSYCAAVSLQQFPESALNEVERLILQHGWRDAAMLLVADPRSRPETVSAVVSAGMAASPWYGALLLQAAPEACTREAREVFLREQLRVLSSPGCGRPEWKRSAAALAKFGRPAAMDILVEVTSERRRAPEAIEAALDGLVMMHQRFVPGATERLRNALCSVMDGADKDAESPEVIACGLRSIQAAELTALAGFAWSRVTPDEPWDVLSQAWRTLRRLGIWPDGARREVYARACVERLTAIANVLRSAADTATAEALNKECLGLLRDLAAEGEVEVLLSHRFRAGLAEWPEWGQTLQRAFDVRRGREAEGAASSFFNGEVLRAVDFGADQLRKMLTLPDEGLVAMAAHHLLVSREVVGVEMLQAMVERRSAGVLAVVAAFVHCLPRREHVVLERLLEPFLQPLEAGSVEAVASFVAAAETLDLDTGRRLALRVQRTLAERGLEHEALHWPWCATWRRVLPPRAETVLFMNEQEQHPTQWPQQRSLPALRELLSSADVLLDAPYVQPMQMSLDLRTQVTRLRPDSEKGVQAHRFVLLAASVGLFDELAFVMDVAAHPYNIETVIKHSHGKHGLVEVALAAHAVTAMGYLGRLEAEEDPGLQTADVVSVLRQLGRKTSSMHPSMERARLIGLAYWEIDPLLASLSSPDPILLAALRHVVTQWPPGPRTTTGEDPYFAEIAEKLAYELRSKLLPQQTRAVMAELHISLENRLGRYVN